MTDNENWQFDLEDLSNDNGDSDGSSSGNMSSLSMLGISTVLMPISVLGIVTFLQESVMVASLSAIGFTGLALEALVAAFSVLGLLTVGGLALFVGMTVIALFVALVKRSVVATVVFLLGFIYLGGAFTIATVFLGGLPLLVGYVIASTMLIYLTVLAVVFFGGTALFALVP
jgi:hypothetical protein